MGLSVYKNGYKAMKKGFTNIDNSWKPIKNIYTNINNSWKIVYKNAPAPFTKIFNSSTIWTIPEGIDKVDVWVVGGGGGGNVKAYDSNIGGGGGGSGYVRYVEDFSLAEYVGPYTTSTIQVEIGAGGEGDLTWHGEGDGNKSRFGSSGKNCVYAYGGVKYESDSKRHKGGNGGSGGGGAGRGHSSSESNRNAGDGGRNGHDGKSTIYIDGGGKGDKVSTLCPINNIYYAGGGGGGTVENRGGKSGKGYDGGGDGYWDVGYRATSNTGGGGGGSGANIAYSGDGGSGIVIIRWKG